MKTEEIISYLLRLSDAKFVLMNNLLKITEEQCNVLETEEVEILDQLIQQKQTTIDKIDLLDKEFAEKYGLLKKELGVEDLQAIGGETIPGFKELKEKVHKIVDIVEKIRPLDQENTEKIKKNIAKVQNNLKNIKNGKKVVKGYNNQFKEIHSVFIDKKK